MSRWLLTIKPEYIRRIVDGSKCYEIRTRVPKGLRPDDTIFVVQSGSGGRVAISFVVRTIIRESVGYAWAANWRCLGIELLDYQKYTEGRRYIYLIGIQQVRIMRASADIHEVGIERAPQWFSLLKAPVNDLWIGTPSSKQ